jgi:metal-responsive CopG/Arc/MetJ family transcriptional regulator
MNKTFGISLSEQDIVEIDEAAWRVRKNRSEFVREVVSEYIHKVKTENPQETAVTA